MKGSLCYSESIYIHFKLSVASFNNFHTIAYLLSIFIWLLECTLLKYTTSYNCIHRVYGYHYSYINSYLYCIATYTETIRIAIIHVIHNILVQLCVIFCLLFHMKLSCLLSALLERVLSINAVECPRCCWELYMQYNLCIIWTHWEFIDYQGVPDYSGKLTSTC